MFLFGYSRSRLRHIDMDDRYRDKLVCHKVDSSQNDGILVHIHQIAVALAIVAGPSRLGSIQVSAAVQGGYVDGMASKDLVVDNALVYLQPFEGYVGMSMQPNEIGMALEHRLEASVMVGVHVDVRTGCNGIPNNSSASAGSNNRFAFTVYLL